jgi:hypothetical protein
MHSTLTGPIGAAARKPMMTAQRKRINPYTSLGSKDMGISVIKIKGKDN